MKTETNQALLKERYNTKKIFLCLKIGAFVGLVTFFSGDTKFPIRFAAAFVARGTIGIFISMYFYKSSEQDKYLTKLIVCCVSVLLNTWFINEGLNTAIATCFKQTLLKPMYYFCLDYVLIDIWFNSGLLIKDCYGACVGKAFVIKKIDNPVLVEASIFCKGISNAFEKLYASNYTFFVLRNCILKETFGLYKDSKRLENDLMQIDWTKFGKKVFINIVFIATANTAKKIGNTFIHYMLCNKYYHFKILESVFAQHQLVFDVAILISCKQCIKFTVNLWIDIVKDTMKGIGIMNVSVGHSPAER